MLAGDINSYWIGKNVLIEYGNAAGLNMQREGKISMITIKKNRRVIIRLSNQVQVECSPIDIITEIPE